MLPSTVFEVRTTHPHGAVDSDLQPGLPSAVMFLARARRRHPGSAVELYVNGKHVPVTAVSLDKKALAKAIEG